MGNHPMNGSPDPLSEWEVSGVYSNNPSLISPSYHTWYMIIHISGEPCPFNQSFQGTYHLSADRHWSPDLSALQHPGAQHTPCEWKGFKTKIGGLYELYIDIYIYIHIHINIYMSYMTSVSFLFDVICEYVYIYR